VTLVVLHLDISGRIDAIEEAEDTAQRNTMWVSCLLWEEEDVQSVLEAGKLLHPAPVFGRVEDDEFLPDARVDDPNEMMVIQVIDKI
jgi:hypothetical protein